MKKYMDDLHLPQCADRRGFTLLEILVALTLIGVAIVVVMQLFSANLRSLALSDSYVNASVRAEAIMRNVLEDEKFPDSASAGSTEDGYRYETVIEKGYEDRTKDLGVDLFKVKITVRWTDGTRERSLDLNTLKMTEKKI